MILSSFKKVFRNLRYVLGALGVAFAVFVFAVWLPNFALIIQIVTSSSIALLDKLAVLTSLIGSIQTNFTILTATYTIAIAILFGINVALLTYYMRRRKMAEAKGGAAAGIGGLISGMFGIGCAACGTIVLGPILTLIGAGGLVALLPFGGQEFGILGVGILGFSVYLAAKKVNQPITCAVPIPSNDSRE